MYVFVLRYACLHHYLLPLSVSLLLLLLLLLFVQHVMYDRMYGRDNGRVGAQYKVGWGLVAAWNIYCSCSSGGRTRERKGEHTSVEMDGVLVRSSSSQI